MKSLNTLVKISTQKLDELRRIVAKHEKEREQLIDYNNKMEDELENERAIASKDPTTSAMFDNYKKMIRERQVIIVKSVKDLDKRLSNLKEEIAIEFGEVKKYETLLARKAIEVRNKELAEETKMLDEIGVSKFYSSETTS